MTERKTFLLRVNPELLEKLQRLAARDLRSLNAEIEYLLWQAVRSIPKDASDDQAE